MHLSFKGVVHISEPFIVSIIEPSTGISLYADLLGVECKAKEGAKVTVTGNVEDINFCLASLKDVKGSELSFQLMECEVFYE